MIRKPTEQDFKEGTAVTVLRETKRAVVETRHGAAHGFQELSKLWIKSTFWLCILTTAIPAMVRGRLFAGLILIGLAYGVPKGMSALLKHADKLPGAKRRPPPPIEPAAAFAAAQQLRNTGATTSGGHRQSGNLILSVAIAMRQAVLLGILGLVLTFHGIGFVLVLIPGLAMVATAALILFKALADRTLVQFDHRSITVNMLLIKGTLDWARVTDITARKHPWWNLRTLVTTGSRRVLVVAGLDDRGAIKELMIPMDLLDLDDVGLTALIADLLCCRAAAGTIVPSWQAEPVAPTYSPTPASDPRESFDPDEIMARYLVDRENLISERGTPPLQFGRKVA